MKVLGSWHVGADCDWLQYFKEVTALSKGRTDVRIKCDAPGVISLVEVK